VIQFGSLNVLSRCELGNPIVRAETLAELIDFNLPAGAGFLWP
jgi:hypothetical protein